MVDVWEPISLGRYRISSFDHHDHHIISGGLVASTFIHKAWDRALSSYEHRVNLYNLRVAEGIQPSTPYINFFSIDHQEMFLSFMNLGYLIITCLLYFFMVKREVCINVCMHVCAWLILSWMTTDIHDPLFDLSSILPESISTEACIDYLQSDQCPPLWLCQLRDPSL